MGGREGLRLINMASLISDTERYKLVPFMFGPKNKYHDICNNSTSHSTHLLIRSIPYSVHMFSPFNAFLLRSWTTHRTAIRVVQCLLAVLYGILLFVAEMNRGWWLDLKLPQTLASE